VNARRLTLASAAVVVAVLAALLAQDLRSWRDAFARDDLTFAASPRARTGWHAVAILPGDPAAALLSVGDDRTLRTGVRLFAASYRTGLGFDSGASQRRLRSAAQAVLARAAQDPDPQRASQAYDLAGILAFGESSSAGGSASATDRAVTDLQTAVRLDPANEDAKANLELLLRLLVARGARPGPTAVSGPRASGRRGAGSGTPGTGY
jgi:hypothetical protein